MLCWAVSTRVFRNKRETFPVSSIRWKKALCFHTGGCADAHLLLEGALFFSSKPWWFFYPRSFIATLGRVSDLAHVTVVAPAPLTLEFVSQVSSMSDGHGTDVWLVPAHIHRGAAGIFFLFSRHTVSSLMLLCDGVGGLPCRSAT